MAPVGEDADTVEIAVPNSMFAAWTPREFPRRAGQRMDTADGPDPFVSYLGQARAPRASCFRAPASLTVRKAESLCGGWRRWVGTGRKPKAPQRTRSPATNSRASSSDRAISSRAAAAIAVAGQPGTLYNPFFLFGGVGLGRRIHQRDRHAIVQSDPSRRVLSLSAETFTNRTDRLDRRQQGSGLQESNAKSGRAHPR